MVNKKLILNLPSFINITVLKQKNENTNIYMYNKLHYININYIFTKNYEYNIETNSIIIIKYKPNKNLIYIKKILNKFIKQLNLYFFFKIKFKGKSYRMRFYKR